MEFFRKALGITPASVVTAGKIILVNVTCEYCGAEFEPYGDYSNYEGPIPCAGCHKSTWFSIGEDQVLDSKKWPFRQTE
ncbi:MAG: hypothetical protein ACHQ1H_03105 [Nitrososphaerales archaeon]